MNEIGKKEGRKGRRKGRREESKKEKEEGQKKAREERKIATNISSNKGNIIITSIEMKEEYINVMSNFLLINPMILMKLTLFKSRNGQN